MLVFDYVHWRGQAPFVSQSPSDSLPFGNELGRGFLYGDLRAPPMLCRPKGLCHDSTTFTGVAPLPMPCRPNGLIITVNYFQCLVAVFYDGGAMGDKDNRFVLIANDLLEQLPLRLRIEGTG